LTRQMLDRLLTDLQTGRTHKTVLGYRKPLRHWLRFQGRLKKPPRPAAWQPWLQDYLEFLRTHRGVGQATLEHAEADVRTFLRWQFGCGPATGRRLPQLICGPSPSISLAESSPTMPVSGLVVSGDFSVLSTCEVHVRRSWLRRCPRSHSSARLHRQRSCPSGSVRNSSPHSHVPGQTVNATMPRRVACSIWDCAAPRLSPCDCRTWTGNIGG
jgi:hypothetical protein